MLASKYKLDADPVYKQQWVSQEVSVYSIQDYLVKVKDHEWALNECLTKCAVSMKAMRKLLDHGLSLTSPSKVFSGQDTPPKNTVLSQVCPQLFFCLLAFATCDPRTNCILTFLLFFCST